MYLPLDRVKDSAIPLKTIRSPYPSVSVADAELHSSPEATWQRLLEDLASARREVVLENFIFRAGIAADAVIDSLRRAAANGAKVRILADAFGSGSPDPAMEGRLKEAGITIRWWNPLRFWNRESSLPKRRQITRTHRRIMVADGKIGWVGGLAIRDSWWPGATECTVRETMLRVVGEAAGQLQDAFDRLWNGQRAAPLRRHLPPQSGELRVLVQSPLRGLGYRRTFRRMLHQAQQRAWVAVPYFIPGPWLMTEIRAALRRKVDVRLLLPGRETDHPFVRQATRRYYGRLLRAGARIFEYQPSFMHSKCSLFDTEHCLVGSANLDWWSLVRNHEAAIEAVCPNLGQQLAKNFEQDYQNSREITLQSWMKRPLWSRFVERFFGLFDRAF